MTRPIISALLLTLSCATSALAAPPAPAANDAKPAIDVLKRYSPKSEPKATSNGNGATLVVQVDSGRLQQVIVKSALFGSKSSRERSVEAYGATVKSPDKALLMRLLRENRTNFGYWSIGPSDEGGSFDILYSSDLPENASTPLIQAVINDVAETSDKLEAELMKKDDY